MITWLQFISMMIQLTISFRLIIIINWNRKNVSLSLQLVRFRFESHSIIIKLRTKKVLICVSLWTTKTQLRPFFSANHDGDEPLNWWISFLAWLFIFCVLVAFFLCLTFDVLHSEMSAHWRFHFIHRHSPYSIFACFCLLAKKNWYFGNKFNYM